MLYNNNDNLPLKFKSLHASNETFIKISNEFNHLFNNKEIQRDAVENNV